MRACPQADCSQSRAEPPFKQAPRLFKDDFKFLDSRSPEYVIQFVILIARPEEGMRGLQSVDAPDKEIRIDCHAAYCTMPG